MVGETATREFQDVQGVYRVNGADVEVLGEADQSERDALHRRFADRLVVRDELTRRLVSYQGNKTQPGLRWFKYKEGFSAELVQSALGEAPGPVLDPFAGLGTAALVASGTGRDATGIELMPIGVRAAQAISAVANGLSSATIESAGVALLHALRGRKAAKSFRFPHVAITEHAFSPDTEQAIARARAFLHACDDEPLQTVLDVACMSVLEEVSYTRKDGQYLRWDERSGRDLRGGMHKGPIPSFAEALEQRLAEMAEDAPELAALYGGRPPKLLLGSALEELATLPDRSIGLTITSPPYANRYDYTRTYALELAWLGYDKAGFGQLRQSLISATVENRSKEALLDREYPRRDIVRRAKAAFRSQGALQESLHALIQRRSELGNPHVIRLVENYFLEMSVIVAELARITQPGGRVVMVNDNVQYHGEEVPVDLILSDIAEACGFECEEISVLPRGKGNASQQMGRFGRRELRKCVYHWQIPG
ncbi:MAG: site-specific DNA-methyltransferase [Chloroflexi bacterium]|nr:site-specific DNA-methyltransferase [Chloroflexota bacterium]